MITVCMYRLNSTIFLNPKYVIFNISFINIFNLIIPFNNNISENVWLVTYISFPIEILVEK